MPAPLRLLSPLRGAQRGPLDLRSTRFRGRDPYRDVVIDKGKTQAAGSDPVACMSNLPWERLVVSPHGSFQRRGGEVVPQADRLCARVRCHKLEQRLVVFFPGGDTQIQVCKSFFSKVLKLLAFQGVGMFLYSRFPLFFPLSGKNKGKSYCTLSSSFAASRLASLLACA